MPATVEAKTPAATTSKIIPPINERAPDHRAALADSVHELSKGCYCGRTQPRKIERAIDGCRSVVRESFSTQTCSDCGASAASCRTPES
jgi:hypothetical protein